MRAALLVQVLCAALLEVATVAPFLLLAVPADCPPHWPCRPSLFAPVRVMGHWQATLAGAGPCYRGLRAVGQARVALLVSLALSPLRIRYPEAWALAVR